MRVLLLNNIPAPYFLPIFRQLGELNRWELVVCFSNSWKSDLGWEEGTIEAELPVRTIYLDQEESIRSEAGRGVLARAMTMLRLLRRERPEYLICYGYSLVPQLTALLWAILTGTRFAVIGDANIHCDRTRGLKRLLKGVWLRVLTRQAAAILTIGKANRQFWEKYGAAEERMFPVPFAVDNNLFLTDTTSRLANRQSEGLTDRVVFISVGRLIARKNVDLLIQAVQQLDPSAPVTLLIAGHGEERSYLESLAGADPRIQFLGGVRPATLSSCYGLADALILAARDEPWGLVTNEAMASGLAVIAHQHCGSTIDLVSDDNGITLTSFEIDELVEAMRQMINDRARLERMKEMSRVKIATWSVEAAVSGLTLAIERTKGDKYGSERDKR